MQNNTSKLNTVLLVLILIVLVFIVFRNKAQAPVPTPEQVTEQMKPQILGHKEDLVYFSILPGTKVHGIKSYRGSVSGGYFFEANILINVLDANKKVLKKSNAMATGEWMTAGPVEFEGNIDFTGLAKGPAYIEIHNDNPSDMRENDKSILIPIIIE